MTRRPSRRGARSTQLPSPLSRAASALAGGSVFLASNYTPAGANIGAFVDLLDPTHTLVQATEANQVLAPTSDSALRGRASTAFATGKTYVSSRAASTWKRLHDGTGGGMCLLWVPETVPASTSNCYLVQTSNSSANSGALLNAVFVTGPTYRTTSLVRTTVSVVNHSYSTSAFTAGAGHAFRTRYLEGGSPEAEQFRFGTQVVSGASDSAPDSGDPAVSLTLGGTTVQNGWTWRFHALFIPPADWTVAQVSAVSKYAQSLGLAGA